MVKWLLPAATLVLLFLVAPSSSAPRLAAQSLPPSIDEHSLSTPLAAAPSTAKLAVVSGLSGQAFVMKKAANEWSEAAVGMTLEAGDRLRVGPDSNVLITFFDGSTIQLEAGTDITIRELTPSGEAGSTIIRLRQSFGKTTNRLAKLANPASLYEIETPAGAAMVRGSTGIVVVNKDGDTAVYNIKGRWCVTGAGVEICPPEGSGCFMITGGSPVLFIPGGTSAPTVTGYPTYDIFTSRTH